MSLLDASVVLRSQSLTAGGYYAKARLSRTGAVEIHVRSATAQVLVVGATWTGRGLVDVKPPAAWPAWCGLGPSSLCELAETALRELAGVLEGVLEGAT